MADQSLPDTIEKANDESMYYDGMKQDEGIWKPPQKMSKVFSRPHTPAPLSHVHTDAASTSLGARAEFFRTSPCVLGLNPGLRGHDSEHHERQ